MKNKDNLKTKQNTKNKLSLSKKLIFLYSKAFGIKKKIFSKDEIIEQLSIVCFSMFAIMWVLFYVFKIDFYQSNQTNQILCTIFTDIPFALSILFYFKLDFSKINVFLRYSAIYAITFLFFVLSLEKITSDKANYLCFFLFLFTIFILLILIVNSFPILFKKLKKIIDYIEKEKILKNIFSFSIAIFAYFIFSLISIKFFPSFNINDNKINLDFLSILHEIFVQ